MISRPARVLLLSAAVIVLLQAIAVATVGVLGLLDLQEGRAGVGVGIGVTLLVIGTLIAWCAVGLARGAHWSRSPVVVTQVIGLGMAWQMLNPGPGTTVDPMLGRVTVASCLIVLLILATPQARHVWAVNEESSGEV